MATADYPDYDALNLLLAAIGTPTPGSGKTLIDVVNSLSTVLTQIQAGSPAITKPVNLYDSGFAAAIAASGTLFSSVLPTTGTSYVLSYQPQLNSSPVPPVISATITVTDAVGRNIDVVNWDLPASAGGGQAYYVLAGPIQGPNIQLGFLNRSAQTGTITASLTASTLPLSKHFCQAVNFGSITGYTTAPNAYGPVGVLASQRATIGSFGNIVYIVPPTSGQIMISARDEASTSQLEFDLYALSAADNFLGASGVPLWHYLPTSSGGTNQLIPMPRCSTLLRVQNSLMATDFFDIGLTSQLP